MSKSAQKKYLRRLLKAARAKELKDVGGIKEIEKKVKLMIKAVDNPSIKVTRFPRNINQYTKSFANKSLDMKALAKAKYHGFE